jgi:hypothetical protein
MRLEDSGGAVYPRCQPRGGIRLGVLILRSGEPPKWLATELRIKRLPLSQAAAVKNEEALELRAETQAKLSLPVELPALPCID